MKSTCIRCKEERLLNKKSICIFCQIEIENTFDRGTEVKSRSGNIKEDPTV